MGEGGPACPKAGTTTYYLGLWEQVGTLRPASRASSSHIGNRKHFVPRDPLPLFLPVPQFHIQFEKSEATMGQEERELDAQGSPMSL